MSVKDDLEIKFTQERISHWNRIAERLIKGTGASAYYYKLLRHFYRHHIPAGQRVLEVGCGTGDILAATNPAHGVGIDFSEAMLRLASEKHPNLTFVYADAHSLSHLSETFDFIILSDLLNDVWDVQKVLEQVACVSHPGTRIIINAYSKVWETPLTITSKLGLSKPKLLQNWLTVEDLQGLLTLSGFEVICNRQEILLPLPIPIISPFFNRYLVRFWPFKHLALTNFIIARSCKTVENTIPPVVSVIVPARNEAGNIEAIFQRVPDMGGGTELIFVEGHSSDDTYQAIEKTIKNYPDKHVKLFRQTGKGKGDAVRLGFAEATGDILMILDADLTVPPEDLPRFYEALVTGKADFVNGVRLVYPMEDQAMRFFNFIGNKFFSVAFTWLLGQSVKDTLCGTKVLRKSDYERIAANRLYFGDFDPFGDFDLLFGAAKLNMKILGLPIRYRERKYGTTNI
ncbi:MAG: bifunctional class I SAM-dependent methyltransferase/glycosyltransferase family 2 protein, partial [Bacteroidota bacterium]